MSNLTGFARADSANLPNVDHFMILEFMANNERHNIAEIRGAKAVLSSRASYLETAVGYVEVRRTPAEHTVVRCKLTPEHRIHNKNYDVSATIDEQEKIVVDASCDGCAAAAGGCKHSVLFLYWLCQKSSQPASTSVECFWKKPRLSEARITPVLAKDLYNSAKKIKVQPLQPGVLDAFKAACSEHDVKPCLLTMLWEEKESCNLFDLMLKFIEIETDHSYENFYKYVNSIVTNEVISQIDSETKNQAATKLWHNVRHGRLTASIIYEVSRCQVDGALVQRILGGIKAPETRAIKRGKKLEKDVIEEVEKVLGVPINRSGFILIDGIVGASPDGVGSDFVVEVKCPFSSKTIKSYIGNNGEIKEKVKAQMHLQMMAAKKTKGVLCLADPQFEVNKKVTMHWVLYQKEFIDAILTKATEFWKTFIFPKMMKSVKA